MRILALDLGGKRIGLAVSDELHLTSQGINVFKRKSLQEDMEYLKDICERYQVSEIVLGYPLLLNGKRGEAAREVEIYQRELEKNLELPVHLWDERLTTGTAERVLLEADVSRKKRKAVRDKLAAVLILESYLSSKNKNR